MKATIMDIDKLMKQAKPYKKMLKKQAKSIHKTLDKHGHAEITKITLIKGFVLGVLFAVFVFKKVGKPYIKHLKNKADAASAPKTDAS